MSTTIVSGRSMTRRLWWLVLPFGLAFVLLSAPAIVSRTNGQVNPPVMTSVPPVNPAYPLQMSATGRYLVDQNEQPVFWSGDAAWSLVAQASNADIDTYLSNRQQKGFNVIIVNLIEHELASNAPRNRAGDAPFTGSLFTTPNDAYFAHADYVISAAAARGIAVLLDPLYLGYHCGDEGWCAEIQSASLADMQSWGNYVGNRYTSFDNVVWVVGGDADPTSASGVSDKATAFVAALQNADGRHLITAHNARGQMAITPWMGASWLTLNDTYTNFQETYPQAQAAYKATPTMPFFQIEGEYENAPSTTTQQVRAEAYWTVLAGGMGYIFGNCPLWGYGAPAAAAFCPKANSDWKEDLDTPGAVAMMHVRELFAPRMWQALVPDWDHATVTAGYGTFGSSDYAAAARTPDGSLAVAYLPSPRSITVDLTQLSGPVSARWYDPSNGAYSDIAGSPFATSGTQQFAPIGTNSAGDGDWVLVLEQSAN